MHYILRAVAGVAATLPGTAASGALATPLPPLKGKGGKVGMGVEVTDITSRRPSAMLPVSGLRRTDGGYAISPWTEIWDPFRTQRMTFGLTPVPLPAYIRRVLSVDYRHNLS